jgi:hypothetical protein
MPGKGATLGIGNGAIVGIGNGVTAPVTAAGIGVGALACVSNGLGAAIGTGGSGVGIGLPPGAVGAPSVGRGVGFGNGLAVIGFPGVNVGRGTAGKVPKLKPLAKAAGPARLTSPDALTRSSAWQYSQVTETWPPAGGSPT